jgi:putative DNA primase/helicase
MTSISEIIRACGGDRTGPNTCNVPGPNHGPEDRSLSIKTGARAPGGFVVHSFADDDPIRCRDYIRERLGLGRWAPQQDPREPLVVTHGIADWADQQERKASALRIWTASVRPHGSIVEFYLREHRGLDLPADIDDLRFHGALRYEGRSLPGMVCLLRSIETNEPCGVHRTFLERETGTKIDRRMLGVAKGAAIKLDLAPHNRLTIAEGIETSLSARAFGRGPVWALGSSGAVKTFPVLRSLNELAIAEENDAASRQAVKFCSRRYLSSRRPVTIFRSPVGSDLNDAWKAAR